MPDEEKNGVRERERERERERKLLLGDSSQACPIDVSTTVNLDSHRVAQNREFVKQNRTTTVFVDVTTAVNSILTECLNTRRGPSQYVYVPVG